MGDLDRFWEKVSASGPNECWNWTAGRLKGGYGQFRVGGRRGTMWVATRWLWTHLHGPIPDGLCVLHRCDNPSCCNPAHLFLGTNLDNIRDRDAKGRQARGDRHWARTTPERLSRGDSHYSRRQPERMARGERHGTRLHPETVARQKGEKHGMSQLTEQDVREIRRLRGAGARLREIAAMFDVSDAHVSNIARGKFWSHVPIDPENND